MNLSPKKALLFACILMLPFLGKSQSVKVLTNHVGYEENKAKHAVIIAEQKLNITAFKLVNTDNNKVVYTGKPVFTGPVQKWKNWVFWTIDFDAIQTPGNYRIEVPAGGSTVSSHPFKIGKKLLEQYTLSDVIYYFKGQRSSGLIDAADSKLKLGGNANAAAIDAHGGWYDATGDYGKHLSHLDFSTYFNPQQITITAYSLLKTLEQLKKLPGNDYRQYKRRLHDEAMFGADYLTRIQTANGSFYRSVSGPGFEKYAKDRVIAPGMKRFGIKKTKDQTGKAIIEDEGEDWKTYQVSYRSGGGVAIAALAIASTYDSTGEYSKADYLKAAERAFAFLEQHNAELTNDGKENILDEYAALTAATELWKATKNQVYKTIAAKKANQLIDRLHSWKNYTDYWRADDNDRPFFHAADAGLPLVSLLYFYPEADAGLQTKIKQAAKRSFTFELGVTKEVNNPFGYSRQLVQDTTGRRRTAFFFPQNTETAPWWQGENARIASIAAAARLGAGVFADDKKFSDSLQHFALDQLNWILGLNPYDASMLQGTGYNNPGYGFFGSFEYTNAPGGIVNGVTGGLKGEEDIDFNLPYSATGKDFDWRWNEQWLPHAAWYLLAISL